MSFSSKRLRLSEKADCTASGVAAPAGQALEPRQSSMVVVSMSIIGKKMKSSFRRELLSSRLWTCEMQTLEGKQGSTEASPRVLRYCSWVVVSEKTIFSAGRPRLAKYAENNGP